MKSFNHVTVESLISDLNDMLSSHASPENIDSSPSKKTSTSSKVSVKENLQSDAISNSVMQFIHKFFIICKIFINNMILILFFRMLLHPQKDTEDLINMQEAAIQIQVFYII